jgi:exonuclease SbcD
MKILHTADWHLGKRLEQFPRMKEQAEVLEEICAIADEEDVDLVLIAGDLFDTYNPPIEAEELFYRTLKKLSKNGQRPVIAIAGNHDSADRINAPNPLAHQNGIILVGYPNEIVRPFALDTGVRITKSEPGFIELILPKYDYPLRLLMTPYANEYRLKTYLGKQNAEENMRGLLAQQWRELADLHCDSSGVNTLVSHLFFMKEGSAIKSEPEDEKPILHVGGAQPILTRDIPMQIQYAALGHLHRYQIVDNEPCPCIYSSSILEYSFSEAHQTKYVVCAELEPSEQVKVKRIEISTGKKLVRKKFDDIDICLNWLRDNLDCYVELTIQTEKYLTGQERRRILQAHENVVTIIPEMTDNNQIDANPQQLDLDQSMEDLFIQYFQHRQGQSPAKSILDLFGELKAIDES